MKRRRIIVGLIAVIFVGVVVAFVSTREREPEYNGKKLSEWLDPSPQRRDRSEEDDAFRHIGAKGLPYYLKALHEPSFRTRVQERFFAGLQRSQLPSWVKRRASAFAPKPWEVRLIRAWSAFTALGEEAYPAIPALIQMVNERNPYITACRAVEALEVIGRKSFPALLTALEEPPTDGTKAGSDQGDRATRFGTNVVLLVPSLVSCMMERDEQLVMRAARALGRLHLEERRVVPVLMDSLKFGGCEVRSASAAALGKFGQKAQTALPALREALADPDSGVRSAARSALLQIAPEVVGTNRVDHF